MTCRICLEGGNTISVCKCQGTHGSVHLACVQQWIEYSGASQCELCREEYEPIVTQHRPQLKRGIIIIFGIINSLLHSYVVIAVNGQNEPFYYSLLFNTLQLVLWIISYNRESTKEQVRCIVLWTIVFFTTSSLLRLRMNVNNSIVVFDYSLTAFVMLLRSFTSNSKIEPGQCCRK